MVSGKAHLRSHVILAFLRVSVNEDRNRKTVFRKNLISKKTCQTVYMTHKKYNLWRDVNGALLRIIVAENTICKSTTSLSGSCQILIKYIEG